MQVHGTRRRYRSALALIPFSILGTTLGCSSAAPSVFETGSPEEQKVAEDLAMGYLDQNLAPEGRVARQAFTSTRVVVDELAMAHVRLQQMQNGVPVFGGEMIVHMNRDGSLFSVTDTHVRTIPKDFNAIPKIDSASAVEAALANYDCPSCLNAPPSADLWILNRQESAHPEPRLAYRVTLERIDGTEHTEAPVVFIDAETGEELWRYNNLQTGSGPSLYSGTVNLDTYYHSTKALYYMEDLTRKMGTFDYRNTYSSVYYFVDNDDFWSTNSQKAAVDAHYGAAKTYDYFKTVHGRDGIDGAGGPKYYNSISGTTKLISSVVHYGNQYSNAFWNSSKMTYGDGDGVSFGPLVSIDICGHEMTHGITERSAGLIYSGESGALNESMSDVFGAMVERYAKGESANTWQIGEDAYTPGTAGDALRNMDDTHKTGDPDHYSERNTGSADNGGVHTNSGIFNYAFYLLAKGGTHHLGGSMADIGQPNGIGADKAAAIWYKALTTYMTTSTGFAGARTATLDAATALYGAGSPEVTAVTQAWFLVGVGSAPVVTCSDKLCTQSTMPLTIGCDPCVTKICATDPYCCNTAWDALCVDETSSICGKSCTTCSSGSFTGPGIGVVPASPSLNFGPSSSFSVAFWAKLEASTQHIVVKGDNSSLEWSIVTNPGNLICFRRQGVPPNLACYTTTPGQWHHYALTHANGNIVWYEDGVQKGAGSGPIGNAAATPLNIGNFAFGDGGIVGEVDQLAMWSKALSAADVQALALRTKPPNYLGSLVAEWKFDEGKGTTVADATGYGHTMTLNTVGWSASCAACPPDTLDVNGDGTVCQPYASCKALIDAKPTTPSGMHLIDPDGPGGKSPFGAYCDMQQDGGGWTLAFNYGTGFTKTSLGTASADCFNNTDCINLAYSELPIGADMMIDGDDVAITGSSQGLRSVVLGVDAQILGKTLHYLMNNGGNWPVEKADNSNVTNTFATGYDCTTWGDYSNAICSSNFQLMLNDVTVGCSMPPFDIGFSNTGNCAGWPQNTGGTAANHWPENYRLWVR